MSIEFTEQAVPGMQNVPQVGPLVRSVNGISGTVFTSSGVIRGGLLSINADPTKFDISDGKGVISDEHSVPGETRQYEIEWRGLTGISVTNIATETVTYVLIDRTGAVIQTSVLPDDSEHRDYIFLGQLAHTNLTSISSVINSPDIFAAPTSQLRDLEAAVGIINDGNSVTTNGANLFLDKTAGRLYMNGINFHTDPSIPSERSYSAASNISWRYRTVSGSGSTVSSVDPNNYDLNGTITALIGSQATNQRVFLTIAGNVVIQYGQVVYNKLTDAIAGVGSESFTTYANLETAALIGIISVERGTTSLEDTAKARILKTSKFGETGGAAAGVSVSTLQNTYNNSSTPEILTDSTRGSVTLRRGSAADSDDVFDVQDNAGTTRFAVTGEGKVRMSGDFEFDSGAPIIYRSGDGDNAIFFYGQTNSGSGTAGNIEIYGGTADAQGGGVLLAGGYSNSYIGGDAVVRGGNVGGGFQPGHVYIYGGTTGSFYGNVVLGTNQSNMADSPILIGTVNSSGNSKFQLTNQSSTNLWELTNSSGTKLSFFTNTGFLGIGSHTPTEPLHIQDAGDPAILLDYPGALLWKFSINSLGSYTMYNATNGSMKMIMTGQGETYYSVNDASSVPAGVLNRTPTIGAFGREAVLIGSDSITNSTTKNMRVGMTHFTNAEEPLSMLVGTSTSASAATLFIGGGNSFYNAFSQVSIYTGNSGAVTGTERARFLLTGQVQIGAGFTSTTAQFGVETTARPQLQLRYDSSNHMTAQVSSAGAVTLDATGTAASFIFSDSVAFPYRAVTANDSFGTSDNTIDVTANNATITLPTAVGIAGRDYTVKNTGAGTVTMATTSSQTIDGQTASGFQLLQYDSLTFRSTGTNWIVIA